MEVAAEAIGPYRVLGVIAHGDRSTVYRAERTGARHLGRVALKALDAGVEAARAARLDHEARALAAAAHPFVANLLDIGRADDRAYLVTELVRGRSLQELLHDVGQMHVARSVSIAMQALAALAHAHAARVIHAALHPAIVLVEQGLHETVKLVGFGRASLADAAAAPAGSLPQPAIAYASPERLAGGAVDGRVDAWSVAVCLYEALAGVHPFAVHAKVPLAAAIAAYEPPPLRALRPEVPEVLEAIVVRGLAKDPARRLGGADELLHALAPFGRPGAVQLPWRSPSSPRAPALRAAPAAAQAAPERIVVIPPRVAQPAPPAPDRFPSLDLRTTELAGAIAPRIVRCAALHTGATSAVAATSIGLFTWSLDDGWAEHRLTGDARSLRGVAVSSGGDALAFGDGGLALLLPRGGPARSLGAPDTLSVHAACVEDEGRALLAGVDQDKRGARSVLVEVRGDDLRERDVETTARFAAIAPTGDAFVGCGERGLFALLHGGVVMTRTCGTYDLRGIAVDADGSGLAVGSRGRVLAFGADGQPASTPDALGVNADLVCACSAGGVLWVAGDGVVLRRDEHGGWRLARVRATVHAIVAEPERACLLFDDGAVHEVRVG